MQRWNLDNGLNNSKSSDDDEQYEARNTAESRDSKSAGGGNFGSKLNRGMNKKYPAKKASRGYSEHR
jgi:hypothetical protein